MELTKLQKEAIRRIRDWRKSSRQQFVLTGYAGTGKTTVFEYILNDLGLSEENVIFACPTGKAAASLRQKGHESASTVASAFYVPVDRDETEKLVAHYIDRLALPYECDAFMEGRDLAQVVDEIRRRFHDLSDDDRDKASDGGTVPLPENKSYRRSMEDVEFVKRSEIRFIEGKKNVELMFVDEASMLNDEQIEDILSFEKPVLFVGDPFQLPPVKGENSLMQEEADFHLDEIHRQEVGNPIIRASEMIRGGKLPDFGLYGSFMRIPENEFHESDRLRRTMFGADQVICGYRRTVDSLNDLFRSDKGYKSELPLEGEKLLCVKNNHRIGLTNGTVCRVVWSASHWSRDKGTFRMDVATDFGDVMDGVEVDVRSFVPEAKDMFHGGHMKHYNQFKFGYAITCHAAQGSEYGKRAFIRGAHRTGRGEMAMALHGLHTGQKTTS